MNFCQSYLLRFITCEKFRNNNQGSCASCLAKLEVEDFVLREKCNEK